ncbi:amino acid ABC transporter substrate-binding protein (PAAT family) [Jatrophihabitans sp. GAS493]|uniref:transporter substrate-binding domain-containing protein n=1 Tax=Jatrophihabitans sp. GAS493 TaxID=1907575 RepID=UPI000BC014D0|nr:transporter substrate-binding domain-containing protein [Jatrophihabitans sp. GAS493]SOD74861.1 amino acid ABC transporter substrate-binding protein (PAAT family) [Jatrophihabitans sp. GAS493]
MNTDGPDASDEASARLHSRVARSLTRVGGGVALAAAVALSLAACSSTSATENSAKTAAGTAASTAIPTQDVVSGIAADPKLKAELSDATQASGKLTLGTTLAPGVSGLPHGGQVDGNYIGLDVDLRNAVAKVLGVTFAVQNGTFATIIPGVQNGKYDVGQDNFGATKAREKVVDFASYLTDGQSFLGSSSVKVDKVTDITDICGLTVATSPGSTFQQILTGAAGKCAAAGKPDFKVQYFADSAPIFLGLANGKVDVYFGPTLSLQYDATHVPNTKYLGQISSTVVGFVTAKGSPTAKALSDAVNELIANGDYTKILTKWGVLEGSGITKSEVNPTPTF